MAYLSTILPQASTVHSTSPAQTVVSTTILGGSPSPTVISSHSTVTVASGGKKVEGSTVAVLILAVVVALVE